MLKKLNWPYKRIEKANASLAYPNQCLSVHIYSQNKLS